MTKPDYLLEPPEPDMTEEDFDLLEEKRILMDYWRRVEALQAETDRAIEAETLTLYEALR